MPELKSEIVETLPEPLEGKTYLVQKAEVFTSGVHSYKGVRVELQGEGGEMHGTVLWLRDVAGDKSKLGSFMKALGSNTDNWLGKRLKFEKWRDKVREVQLVP